MPTIIHQRVEECRQGTYPKAICRVKSGWVVLGDVQFVKGYSLLLPDPVVADLNQLSRTERELFLFEMTAIGDAMLKITDAVRVNYEMLGNLEPALHAHIFPRYETEPVELRTKPVWFYDWPASPPFDENEHRPLMEAIKTSLGEAGLVIET